MRVDATRAPGQGIVTDTMQFHGAADRYGLTGGATALATLYSNASTATSAPALTSRNVGANGGSASAFTYDLARSVVLTRQGNPAWAGQERDGTTPIRSDDLFYGPAAGDNQPNWVDLSKVAIPQADEQQRLLANLIGTVTADKKPIPRFWYLPRGLKAAVIMTGDDHAAPGGTAGRFAEFAAASPAGCNLAQWECIRGTSYVYPHTNLTNAQAASYASQGFEVGLHLTTDCADYTPASIEGNYVAQIDTWSEKYTSLAQPVTLRTHCIAWSDWVGTPRMELDHGIRLDANYYYWPPGWVQDVPGMFTGSGMPMRFADTDGSMIDVYQSTTQMTDESGQTFPFTINTLLDRALGAQGYYGAFNANMHTDAVSSPGATAIVASAKARGVPVVTAQQMLTWLDGRNGSTFEQLNWNGTTLSFRTAIGAGATGLRAMLPATFGGALAADADARRRGGQLHARDDQGRLVRDVRGRDRPVRRELRRRHGRAGDQRAGGDRVGGRLGHDHVDDRRAVRLARRLRHLPDRAHADADRRRRRDGPQRPDHRAHPRHHVPVPGPLGGPRGQRGDRPDRDAGDVPRARARDRGPERGAARDRHPCGRDLRRSGRGRQRALPGQLDHRHHTHDLVVRPVHRRPGRDHVAVGHLPRQQLPLVQRR